MIRTRLVAIAVLIVLAAAACSDAPPEDQLIELIEHNSLRLTDIDIDDVDGLQRDRILVTGTATVRTDLVYKLEGDEIAEACGRTLTEYVDSIAGQHPTVVQFGALGAAPAEFAYEIVPRQVEVGSVDSDGDVRREEDLTSEGWLAGVWGGQFEVEGTPHFSLDLGWPPEWWGDGLLGAIYVGTPEFETLCETIVS